MEADTGPVGQGSSNILQTFWGLSSLEEHEQLSAAKQLITSLNKAQVSYSSHVLVILVNYINVEH